ncbi:hypothetical protein [Achromobacter ruhlandii]|uniref:hypothetical protein n=1 Tax=Achromobacter ruhlandii TaxID=72557 RepID=UPI0012E8B62B|nr:hypothetical protein [Achromobacter ruhlandii]
MNTGIYIYLMVCAVVIAVFGAAGLWGGVAGIAGVVFVISVDQLCRAIKEAGRK